MACYTARVQRRTFRWKTNAQRVRADQRVLQKSGPLDRLHYEASGGSPAC